MMENTTKDTAAPVKANEANMWRKALRVATYPAALISGLWMVERDVHTSTYNNLKRYKAFDKILGIGKHESPDGLVARNEQNVQDRICNLTSVEEFLEKSRGTKMEYRAAIEDRMTHLGLGKGYKNFVRKWDYIDKPGKIDALLKGATVVGITAVVLTALSSKPLLELLGLKDSEKER